MSAITRSRLRFSDDSHGVFDFTPFLEAGTSMTEPLRDPAFFRRFFLEMGVSGLAEWLRPERFVPAKAAGRERTLASFLGRGVSH